ncbi:MAG: type IX secretion system membrane protein PorP/SprF [Bacteroidota bacterium]
MLRYLKIILFVLLQIKFAYSQDMHFTQFYASPLYLNPAFTGANVCSRATLIYRNQWAGIKKGYESYMFSMDHYLSKQHVGIGLQAAVDQAGTGGLRTTIINPSLAYETNINKTIAIRFGLQPGVVIKSIQFDRLLFGDQIARGGSANPGSVSTVETRTANKAFFDIGAGTLVYTSNYWLGASFFHLTRPNESLYDTESATLPIKYSVHGGTKIFINKEEKDPDLKKSVSIVMHYRGQGKFDQFDIGTYYSQRGISLGIWYRGIPGLKAYKPGYSNNDALAFVTGFQQERFNIGYSYDITISQLQRLTNGAHEVTLSYQFCSPKKKKVKRVLVSCPKF